MILLFALSSVKVALAGFLFTTLPLAGSVLSVGPPNHQQMNRSHVPQIYGRFCKARRSEGMDPPTLYRVSAVHPGFFYISLENLQQTIYR